MVNATAAASGRILQFWDVERDLDLECDVLIVGSGAGGATVAAECAAAGLDVVVLEEGGFHDSREFTADAIEGVKKLYRGAGSEMVFGKPRVIFAQGRCVGGSTVINGGMSWRTPERVLETWRRDFGLAGLGAGDLEPVFKTIEERIHVNVQAPETIGRDGQLLKLGADRLGWKITANTRNQRHCMGSNNCAFGCPTGGKQSMLVSYLPRALAAGARIYADCRVEKVLVEAGRARSVRARLVDPATRRPGPALRARARRAVVLACGATETPLLLLRSGLANGSGAVGRHLTLHPNAKCVAVFDEEVTPWKGVHQAYQVHHFLEEGIDIATGFVPPQVLAISLHAVGDELHDLLSQMNRIVVGAALIEDTGEGRVRRGLGGLPYITYDWTERDLANLVRGAALFAELMFTAGAKLVIPPFPDVPPLRSIDEARALVGKKPDPRRMEVFTVHLMGTCRMAADPRRGVVGPGGEAHDVKGLYVAD
ncbi:MAG TPA: GMC family oxidoreductase, partial [Planctomycetota bacterium]|nr:GMC family oxidoreductase [Planctomycetota bacterium]